MSNSWNVPREVQISYAVIAKISHMKSQNFNISDSVEHMKRNWSVKLMKFYENFDNVVTKQRLFRLRRTSLCQDRGILRALSTQKKTVRENAKPLAYSITRSIVNCHLQASKIYKTIAESIRPYSESAL